MSVTFEVTVSDELGEKLSEYDDERIAEEMRDALDGLASTLDKRDNLHRRLGIDSDTESEELSDEAEARREKIRRQRREGSGSIR